MVSHLRIVQSGSIILIVIPIFQILLSFGVHGGLHLLLILIAPKVLSRRDVVLVVEVAHGLQELFLLFDLGDAFGAFLLVGVTDFSFLACEVFGDVLTIDSRHGRLRIIRDIFVIFLVRVVNRIVPPVSVVAILTSTVMRLVHLADLSRKSLRHIAEITNFAYIDVSSLTHFGHTITRNTFHQRESVRVTHHLGLRTLSKSRNRVLRVKWRHRAAHHLILATEGLLIRHLHALVNS